MPDVGRDVAQPYWPTQERSCPLDVQAREPALEDEDGDSDNTGDEEER